MRLIRPMRLIRFATKKSILAILAIIVIGIPLLYLTVLNSKPASAWFNENWLYRIPVPISAHTAAENNVYITVTLDTATPITAGKMQSDCGDLRFIKENGELLPYFINASPGCNNAATTIQVQFKSFPAGAQTIYYYYGNPSAPNGFSSAAFSTAATGATIGTIGSETQGPGPVGYWKFDDGQGTTALDASSSKNNGTLSGTTKPTWQTEDRCVSGKCLYFDGSTSYTDSGTNASLNITGTVTVEAWIRPTVSGNSAYRTILAKRVNGDTTNYELYLNNAAGANAGKLSWYNGGGEQAISTYVPVVNQWTHVAATVSGGTNLTIYANGVAVYTGSIPALATNAGILGIGRAGSYAGEYFNGFIDEPKVYNYARSAAQVKTDYLAGKANAAAHSGTGAVLGSSPQDWLSNGLVGYWKMDEASTPSVDSSGNGNSGTWAGNTAAAAGKFGNAISLNGTSDYLSVADSSVWDVGTGDFTIAGWFNATSFDGNHRFVFDMAKTADGTSRVYFAIRNSPSCYAAFGIGSSAICDAPAPSTGTWHHFVARRAGGTMYLYIDGALTGTPIADTTNINAVDTVRIGSRYNSDATSSWNGKLDEIRVYNRALSPTEITNLYNWAPGPVVNLKMEEGQGTAANDSSGNSNNGTVNSGTWTTGKYGKGVKVSGSSGSNVSVPDIAY